MGSSGRTRMAVQTYDKCVREKIMSMLKESDDVQWHQYSDYTYFEFIDYKGLITTAIEKAIHSLDEDDFALTRAKIYYVSDAGDLIFNYISSEEDIQIIEQAKVVVDVIPKRFDFCPGLNVESVLKHMKETEQQFKYIPFDPN